MRSLYRLSLATAGFASPESLLEEFKSRATRAGYSLDPLASAAFGVAGVIADDQAVSGNLPWVVSRAELSRNLKLPLDKTLLVNDLVAAASSLAHLKQADLLQLNQGAPQARAPRALIAAGTGLGEAILFWDGAGYRVSPCEAGLTDFAPRNERELLLLQGLRERLGRVVTEVIVSGRGFPLIHQVLFPHVHHAFFDEAAVDAAARITEQALAGSCAACRETLEIWIGAYASEAGNMALRLLPFGGVYVAGGIALKILSRLKDGSFVRVFSDKGKLRTQLAKIPIFVILNEDAPVLGAAQQAWAASGRPDHAQMSGV